jgi:superfamily II DNA or RNA helicase
MSCKIRIQNVNTYIEGVFPKDEVDRALSFYVKGFYMSDRYRLCPRSHCKNKIIQKTGRCCKCGTPRSWDGRKLLLQGGSRTTYFPTGCLSIVAAILAQFGFKPEYIDERVVVATVDPNEAYSLILRDPDDQLRTRTPWAHQQSAIAAALSYHRGVIQVPTSGGKTSIMAGLSKILNTNGVILINKTTLAAQIRREISAMIQEPVGFIGSGKFEPERLTVCMTQSLVGGLGMEKGSVSIPEFEAFVKSTQMLILEECHHASSNSWYTLCKEFKNAYYRYGVTGTPFMRTAGDDILLVGATGGLIYEVSEEELIKDGKLAQPIIHFYRIDKPGSITDEATYQEAYELGVVQNEYLNKLVGQITTNLAREQKQILILSERLEHIRNIEKHLQETEYVVLTGDTPQAEREIAINRFEKGEIQVIVATQIFDEGISIQNIDAVIRTGLLKTPIKTKQQVGRGQRTKNRTKTKVHIIDFFHTTNKYLTNHSEEHYNAYTQLRYPITVEEQALTTIDN